MRSGNLGKAFQIVCNDTELVRLFASLPYFSFRPPKFRQRTNSASRKREKVAHLPCVGFSVFRSRIKGAGAIQRGASCAPLERCALLTLMNACGCCTKATHPHSEPLVFHEPVLICVCDYVLSVKSVLPGDQQARSGGRGWMARLYICVLR